MPAASAPRLLTKNMSRLVWWDRMATIIVSPLAETRKVELTYHPIAHFTTPPEIFERLEADDVTRGRPCERVVEPLQDQSASWADQVHGLELVNASCEVKSTMRAYARIFIQAQRISLETTKHQLRNVSSEAPASFVESQASRVGSIRVAGGLENSFAAIVAFEQEGKRHRGLSVARK